jgi:PAS domain S-box-containing protein
MTTTQRILILTLLAGIFVLDSYTPLGFSTWLLYIFPVLYVSAKAAWKESVFWLSLISALVIADLFISPPGIPYKLAVLNRTFYISAIWILYYLNFRRRESEEKLQTIFDSSGDAIFVHDPDGKILDINQKILEMYGVDYQQALSLSIFELSSPDNPLHTLAEIWSKVVAGEDQFFEWKARRPKDYGVFEVEVYLTRIELKEGTAILAMVRDITQRKQLEEELRLTRFSVEHASICAYLVGPEARFLYVNEQACRTLGYTREELLSMTVHDLDPDFPPAVWPAHWAKLKKKNGLHFETSHRRKDGTMVPMEMTLNFLAFGGREYNVAFGMDISERKKAEQEIAKINHRNELVLKSAGEGIVGLDAQGRVTFFNRAAAGMLGYGEQELIGRQGHAMWHCSRPDGTAFPADECPVFIAGRDGTAQSGEAVFWRKDGTSFPVNYTSTPFREAGLSGAVVTFRNITERKRAEEALQQAYAGLETKVQERTEALAEVNSELRQEIAERQRAAEALQSSEKRFRDLIEATSDWVWEIDSKGIFTYASPQVRRILGYEPEEVLAKTIFDFMPPKEAERIGAIFEEIVATRKPFSYLENMNQHKDGSMVVLESSGVPFFDTSGAFRGYRGIDRDITDRKRAEEELQKAQKLESIGLLAGGIAHDFNNILMAIQGNIELARMFLPRGEKATERLAVAEKAAMRARKLSRQLLTFAMGGAPITAATDIRHLLRETVGLTLRGSNVRGEYRLAEDLPPVEADESQLNQVISNLVLNAVEAMPAGGVFRVTAVKESLSPENTLGLPSGEYVRIDIEDQGVGIPAELQRRIFDPYFTTKEGGTGLGLAISFSIVRRHGGAITVESTPGKGSTFSVFLPASQKKVAAGKEEAHREDMAGSGRILVMDDEVDVSDVAAEMLSYLGYQVQTVRDGSEAVAAYRQAQEEGEAFAAVITDLTVPAGMGGKETVRRLLEINPQARVIVSSGYANDPIMSEYADYGFKGVIPKPYRLDELGRVLREVISEGEAVGV